MEGVLDKIIDFNAYNAYIDMPIIVLYVLVGYYLKHNFTAWKWAMELKVLLVGTSVVLLYVATLLVTGTGDVSAWPKLLFSYVSATSLYEIILKRFQDKNGKDPDDNDVPPADGGL